MSDDDVRGPNSWYGKMAAKIAAEKLTVHVFSLGCDGQYGDAIAIKKAGGSLSGLGPWLSNFDTRVPDSIDEARRMQLFVPCWRDFMRFALLIDGYRLTPSGDHMEVFEETKNFLERPRRGGVLPTHGDELLALHRVLFQLQRQTKWSDSLTLSTLADASMLVATIRNHVLRLAATTDQVRRRPHDRSTTWPQPPLEPGDTLELDVVVGIDPITMRVTKADNAEVDVPWIPMEAAEPEPASPPAEEREPRRDGLTTVLEFEPRTRYEVSIVLPPQAALTPWHTIRLSDELIRAGVVLEMTAPVVYPPEPPTLRLYLRSRRVSTRVAVSAGAILGYLSCTFQPHGA